MWFAAQIKRLKLIRPHYNTFVVLGGVMVIVLAIYLTFTGSNPAERDGFLREVNIWALFHSEEK
jgi:hypothetical protein